MKSIKISLFVAAALAVALSFASCSNDTQDVYVTNFNGYLVNSGTASGSIAPTNEEDKTKYSIDGTRFAEVSYSSTAFGNTKEYKLEVPYTYKSDDTTYLNKIDEITVKKVNDKYYDRYGDELTVEGSLEGDEFTIAKIYASSYTSFGYNTLLLTNLKFTKAK